MTVLGLRFADGGPYATSPAVREAKRMNRRAWKLLSNDVIDGQGGQCLICGERGNLTCHHVVPRRDGGVDSRENLIGLCATDHTTLHLVERDVPLRSRLPIAVMVILGPSPAVCRFLRFAFPLLIRSGIGFHPAALRLCRVARDESADHGGAGGRMGLVIDPKAWQEGFNGRGSRTARNWVSVRGGNRGVVMA